MGERKMCSFEVFKSTYLEGRVTIKTYSAKCLAGLLIWCQAELLVHIHNHKTQADENNLKK